MFHNWYECKIKYDKTLDTGMIKSVTEPYLVDALSFTEAEANITKEIKPFITGEFGIAGIRRRKFSEVIFNDDGDRFYNARLNYLTLDEKSGSAKKTNVNMLVQANDILEAHDLVEELLNKTMIDYVIIGITESTLMDVFKYEEKQE